MDRQLLERMVGAAVLIVALVVIAPAILDGPGDRETGSATAPLPDGNVRTVTIRPDRPAAEPPVARQSAPPSVPAAPAPANETAPKSSPKPPAQSAEPKVAKSETPPAEKPRAKPKPAPRTQPGAQPARSGWAVQLGSFANRDNAKRLAGEVSAKGYDTYLLPLEKGGRTLYRVRVGPKSSREAAEKLAGELAKAGYKGQVAVEGQAT